MQIGDITQTLVHDVFNLNTKNRKVQERRFIERFAKPLDALQNATFHQEGMKRQKLMGLNKAEQVKAILCEPVFAMDESNKKNLNAWGRQFHNRTSKKRSRKNHQCDFCLI